MASPVFLLPDTVLRRRASCNLGWASCWVAFFGVFATAVFSVRQRSVLLFVVPNVLYFVALIAFSSLGEYAKLMPLLSILIYYVSGRYVLRRNKRLAVDQLK